MEVEYVAEFFGTVPPNQTYTGAIWLKSKTQNQTLSIQFYIGNNATEYYSVPITTGSWTKFTFGNLSADSGNFLSIRTYGQGGIPDATYFVDSVIVELSSTYTGDYFDGNTTDTATFDYAWTGTPNASTSTATILTTFTDIAGAIPLGGTTGQVLSKTSGSNYATAWTGVAQSQVTNLVTDLGLKANLTSLPNTNLLINGAFEINQRGYVSGASLASGVYGFDRWKATSDSTTLTYTSAPQGQLLTINSGGSIEQVIEQQNVRAGTYTLSWTGTATARIYNTGATPPSYAASPITVTLDGLANVEVEFRASGGTRTVGFVQLESGSVATPFRRNGSTIEAELSACQRYYYRIFPAAASRALGFINATSTVTARMIGFFPVKMRIRPTAVETTGINFHYGVSINGTTLDPDATPTYLSFTSAEIYALSWDMASYQFNGYFASGDAGIAITRNAAAYLGWSAEL
jgi:hypothetical protein